MDYLVIYQWTFLLGVFTPGTPEVNLEINGGDNVTETGLNRANISNQTPWQVVNYSMDVFVHR